MKAFIFNSGSGTRLKDLTVSTPKALVKMKTGETILGRQIRILRDQGIKDFVITTGPHADQIETFVKAYPDLHFTLINSDNYLNTNSIYSMYIARAAFDDDFIILHGDLVFDEMMVKDILRSSEENLVLINKSIPKPPKDFKGRVEGSYLREISVNIFDLDCFALQPFYKLKKTTIDLWLKEIEKFIMKCDVKVYAENALNSLLSKDLIKTFDYDAYFVDEIDNLEDYERVSKNISTFDYQNQLVVESDNFPIEIIKFMKIHQLKRPLLVHGKHIEKNPLFLSLLEKIDAIHFSAYSPNPKYEEIVLGHQLFTESRADSIIAIGGGSAIDVAKAIKLYNPYPVGGDLISTAAQYVDLKLIAIPTTAGTGSESTKYSVMYYQGEKQSLTNDSLVPDLAILSPSLLKDLPTYQRKATLLDALSQAIEGFWALNATPQAASYSAEAISLILKHYKNYILGDNHHLSEIMRASNLAGKAINISATTAPHAMSYMITSLTGISHGHAVALTLSYVYELMVKEIHGPKLRMPKAALLERFNALASFFNVDSYLDLVSKLHEVYQSFELEKPLVSEEEIDKLTRSVNPERLGNNPLALDHDDLKAIYLKALSLKN